MTLRTQAGADVPGDLAAGAERELARAHTLLG